MKKNKDNLLNGYRKSVLEWTLELKFKSKEQMRVFIEKLLEFEIDYSFTYDSDGIQGEYCLTIHTMSWAGNLLSIAELLLEIDHDSI